MGARKLAADQPDHFAFSSEGEKQVQHWLAKYPQGRDRSAVIPLLWIAQKDNGGWLSEAAMRVVGERLGMSRIRVLEIATFYTMFKLAPVGKHLVQVCGTTPCMLRGSDKLIALCKSRIGKVGETSKDGNFTWEEVECLGACVNAPMVQVSNAHGDHYFEDLDEVSMNALLDDLAAGREPAPGPKIDRDRSAPEGDALTLTDPSLYDGSLAKPLKSIPNAPEPSAKPVPAKKTATKSKAATNGATTKPKLLKKARKAGADALQRIDGVGPKIEAILHELGVYHFDQIAVWTKKEIDWVDERLKFKGRITREKWVAQAKKLVKGAGK